LSIFVRYEGWCEKVGVIDRYVFLKQCHCFAKRGPPFRENIFPELHPSLQPVIERKRHRAQWQWKKKAKAANVAAIDLIHGSHANAVVFVVGVFASALQISTSKKGAIRRL
jgi:hypothetical protein